MSITLEMPTDEQEQIAPGLPDISNDGKLAIPIVQPVNGNGQPISSNGKLPHPSINSTTVPAGIAANDPDAIAAAADAAAITTEKRHWWLTFPKMDRDKVRSFGLEVSQGSEVACGESLKMLVRCDDEVKGKVSAAVVASTWEPSTDTPPFDAPSPDATSPAAPPFTPAAVQLEPLCEQPDADDSKTVVIDAAAIAAAGEPATAEPVASPVAAAPTVPPAESPGDKLHNAESELLECALEIAEVELVIGAAKDRLKYLREQHAGFAENVQRLRSGQSVQSKLPAVKYEPSKSAPSPETPAAAIEEEADNTWRTVPTADIVKGIKGLGKKKLEALLDAYPTLGELEDARAKAGPLGLATELPKSLGQKIADDIEDAIVEHLAKVHSQSASPPGEVVSAESQITEPVTSPIAAPADSSPADASPAAVSPPASESSPPSPEPPAKKPRKPRASGKSKQKELPPDEAPAAATASPVTTPAVSAFDSWEAMSEDQQKEFVRIRVVKINTGEASCLESKHPNGSRYWDSGYEDYGRLVDGEESDVTDCPYVPGPEADDWIRGWLSKQNVENSQQGDSQTLTMLSDIDDL